MAGADGEPWRCGSAWLVAFRSATDTRRGPACCSVGAKRERSGPGRAVLGCSSSVVRPIMVRRRRGAHASWAVGAVTRLVVLCEVPKSAPKIQWTGFHEKA
jgi:hypothetical protein